MTQTKTTNDHEKKTKQPQTEASINVLKYLYITFNKSETQVFQHLLHKWGSPYIELSTIITAILAHALLKQTCYYMCI